MRCLDANVVITVLNDSSPKVTARFDSLAPVGDLALPVPWHADRQHLATKSLARGLQASFTALADGLSLAAALIAS